MPGGSTARRGQPAARTAAARAHGGRAWTYAAAHGRVQQYAAWLRRRGVGAGDVVGLDVANSHRCVWLWLAVCAVGASPALFHAHVAGAALAHCIRSAAPCLIVVDADARCRYSDRLMAELGYAARPHDQRGLDAANASSLPSAPGRSLRRAGSAPTPAVGASPDRDASSPRKLQIVFLDEGVLAHIESLEVTGQSDEAPSDHTASDTTVLIFTSGTASFSCSACLTEPGTTGMPKPVLFSMRRAYAAGRFLARWIPLKESDVLYTVSIRMPDLSMR